MIQKLIKFPGEWNKNTQINDKNKQDDDLIDAGTPNHGQREATPLSGVGEIDESKKKRGRPKGSQNKPQAKAKATESRAKAKKHEVTNVISDTSDTNLVTDTLPAYVQQSPNYAVPQPQDLASQLFGLLHNHERERTNRRRATYASWVTKF